MMSTDSAHETARLYHGIRALERESERLDNDAGRAFRLYLAARFEGRPPAEIAVLKAAYDAAAVSCRSFRVSARDGSSRSVLAN